MAPMTLPPGFRFHPTDEELVAYYLHRKINGGVIELEVIPEVDLYKCEPWDLPDKSFLPSKDMEWYFYSPRDRKYPNGSRTNRATRAGYWKATGKDRAVQSEKRPVGMKKTLVYYKGRAPHGIRTDWVMHEYRLIQSAPGTESPLLDSYALCRVFKKNIIIPKTKETVLETTSTFDQLLRDDIASAETSREDDALLSDENINKNRELFQSKFPSDASSSDITQTTTTTPITKDDSLPHITSDEVNSSIDQFYCLGAENMSHFIQDARIQSNYTGMYYETPACPPPLAMEDFPQIDLTTAKSISEYMNCDRFRECINGITTLEEIYSIYSSSHLNF